jgi:hypothetical protein
MLAKQFLGRPAVVIVLGSQVLDLVPRLIDARSP